MPELLIPAAKSAGIKLPNDLENFDSEQYPHWHVLCIVMLGMPLDTRTEHFDNANIIALFSNEEILQATMNDLIDKGLKLN